MESLKVLVIIVSAAALVRVESVRCAQIDAEYVEITHLGGAAMVGQQEGNAWSLIPVDNLPTITFRVDPEYPKEALQEGIEGRVWIRMSIDTTGRPHIVEVLKSSNVIFNLPTVTAAKQFRFKPASKDGKRVPVWVTIPFKYSVGSREDDTSEVWEMDRVVGTIEQVLQGENPDRIKWLVWDEAQFIDGTTITPLIDVVNDSGPSNPLRFEPSAGMVLKVTESNSSIILLFTGIAPDTRNAPIHSVMLDKSKTGEWRIRHWHVSR
jgi:TonB family protein